MQDSASYLSWIAFYTRDKANAGEEVEFERSADQQLAESLRLDCPFFKNHRESKDSARGTVDGFTGVILDLLRALNDRQ